MPVRDCVLETDGERERERERDRNKEWERGRQRVKKKKIERRRARNGECVLCIYDRGRYSDRGSLGL